jgi:hypothetical protein
MDKRVPESLRREGIRHPVNAFRRTDHEDSVGVEGLIKALTEATTGALVEVN